MGNIYRQIKTYGIFANTLKIIALVAMLVDHIAVYFYWYIPETVQDVMRRFGRIAMPLFVFLLVQGFFKTKNFKEYVIRVGICAITTQVLISILGYINVKFYPDYAIQVYTFGNILFSFVLALLLLKIVHEPIILSKYTKEQNIIIRIILGIAIMSIYVFVNIDYGVTVPILAMLLYAVERFRITVLITKSKPNFSFKGIVINTVDELTIDRIYKGLIVLCLLLVIVFCKVNIWALVSALPIILYNGEKRSQRKRQKMFYYVFFPLHHALLYLSAMLIKNII